MGAYSRADFLLSNWERSCLYPLLFKRPNVAKQPIISDFPPVQLGNSPVFLSVVDSWQLTIHLKDPHYSRIISHLINKRLPKEEPEHSQPQIPRAAEPRHGTCTGQSAAPHKSEIENKPVRRRHPPVDLRYDKAFQHLRLAVPEFLASSPKCDRC